MFMNLVGFEKCECQVRVPTSSRATVRARVLILVSSQGRSSCLCKFWNIQLHGALFTTIDIIHVTTTNFSYIAIKCLEGGEYFSYLPSHLFQLTACSVIGWLHPGD